jgi:hypothetical protein
VSSLLRLAELKHRVWSRIRVSFDWDACWTWRGALSLKRAGERRPHVWDGTRMVSVARLMCEWHHGPPPTPEHQAGHTCPTGENAQCVNPRHLEWQTREENLSRRRRAA